MSTFYATGPILVYIGPQIIKPSQYTPLPTTTALSFLGTAEVSPQDEIRRQFQPGYNDLGGAVAFDISFLGMDAILAIDLTKWSEFTYANAIACQPRGFYQTASSSPRGRYNAINEVGSLMAAEGRTLTFYWVFPKGLPQGAPQNAAYTGNGMPVGYRWHGCVPINDKDHQLGSKHKKLHLTVQASPIYDNGTADMVLYDHLGITGAMATPQAIA